MNLSTKIGYLFAKKGIDKLKERMDYKAVGGALLLGVNGVVVKGHGNSDEYSFTNALKVAYKMLKDDVVNCIKEGICVDE
jgi:glycerol-3-phosphate acyltransferase PlsX